MKLSERDPAKFVRRHDPDEMPTPALTGFDRGILAHFGATRLRAFDISRALGIPLREIVPSLERLEINGLLVTEEDVNFSYWRKI